jgi:periplasmic copper chaperone A
MFSRMTFVAATASLAAGLCLNMLQAEAHIGLDRKEAAAGSYYKATFRVPHGCEGSPTIAIRVTLPAGILSAKPQPKPGWTLAVEKATLPEPVKGPHGKSITEVVKSISWSGGSLEDAFFDEFSIQLRLPDEGAGTTLFFPVLQAR